MKRIGAAIVLALAPAPALANVGVGYFMVALPLVFLALVPAILIEAPVLKWLLKLPWPRALWLSFVANGFSALFGFVLGLGFDLALGIATGTSGFPPTRGGATLALLPWFFLTWWIEHKTLAKRLPEAPRPAIRQATGLANFITYLLMFVAAVASPLFPVRDQSVDRARLSEAVLSASDMRTRVTEFWQTRKRFPVGEQELGYGASAGERFVPKLGKDGRISVLVQGIGNPELDGRRIELTPRADGPLLTWICSSPDIERKYLPASCRH